MVKKELKQWSFENGGVKEDVIYGYVAGQHVIATGINSFIGGWDTSQLTNMSTMFTPPAHLEINSGSINVGGNRVISWDGNGNINHLNYEGMVRYEENGFKIFRNGQWWSIEFETPQPQKISFLQKIKNWFKKKGT